MRKRQNGLRLFPGALVRALLVIVVAIGCAIALLACGHWFSGDSSEGSYSGNNTTSSSVQTDAYEAKLQYYQAQVKALTDQLSEMEQQIYLAQSQYEEQIRSLEQKMGADEQKENPNENDQKTPKEDISSEIPDSSQDAVANNGTDHESGVKRLAQYTYRLENGEAILTSYTGDQQEVIVPAAVDGYRVVGLDDSVFAGSHVTSVTLPETVKTLGWFAFYECESLEKVILPAGICQIGYASFDGCPPTLCLHVDKGSYAEQYAISFGLHYQNQA